MSVQAGDGRDESWFDAAFRAPYLEVYAHRDDAAARREVAWVASCLEPSPGLVLDAGCGAGRHARALGALGLDVVGLDRSFDLLAAAVRGAGPPRYVQADFRALPFGDARFAGLVSLFTAFGYFDDAGNELQLREFRRALCGGGTLVLDFLNADHVRKALVPSSMREVSGRSIRETRAIRDGRVEKDVQILDAAGAHLHGWRESVRLYGREELYELLSLTGFVVRSIHGDLEGRPFSSEGSRLVIVAEAA